MLLLALADPIRRHVVQLLGERPRRPRELSVSSGVSAPAMSRHLRVLLEAGIVVDERVPSDAVRPGLPPAAGADRRVAGVVRPAPGAVERAAAIVQASRRTKGGGVTTKPSMSCTVDVRVDPQITVWEPGVRLQWLSSVDDVEVDVRFAPVADGTNVEVATACPARWRRDGHR